MGFIFKIRKITRFACVLTIGSFVSTPAFANQWVSGDFFTLTEWGGQYSGIYGFSIELNNKAWGGGSTSNGGTACTGAFRVVVGTQGVTEEIKNRIWSAVLTAQASGQKLLLYVDTGTTAPNCAVQSLRLGGPLP